MATRIEGIINRLREMQMKGTQIFKYYYDPLTRKDTIEAFIKVNQTEQRQMISNLRFQQQELWIYQFQTRRKYNSLIDHLEAERSHKSPNRNEQQVELRYIQKIAEKVNYISPFTELFTNFTNMILSILILCDVEIERKILIWINLSATLLFITLVLIKMVWSKNSSRQTRNNVSQRGFQERQ